MRRILEIAALVLLAAAVVLGAILVGRGSKVVPTVAVSPTAKAAQSSNAAPAVKAQASLPCPPPPGLGVPGACTPKPVQVFGSTKAAPKVIPATVDPPASIPDVSSWQGVVDWNAVKNWQLQHGFKPAGIFKMGEFVLDPYAWRNNDQLRKLGMWRAGYWFLRKTGCVHEGQQIVDEAHALGLKVIEEDDETPEAAGYDGCITAYVHSHDPSIVTGEYASPGAYPGGSRSSNPAWIAAYGPLNPPAAPWGGPITAFQCTDGVFGCVTNIPGIGRDDVSVDYGITKLGVGPPPDPLAIFPKARFRLRFGVVASEYNTYRTWVLAKCENPVRRPVCKSTRYHLLLLRDRQWFVARHVLGPHGWHAVSPPRWGSPKSQPIGPRFAYFSRALSARHATAVPRAGP